MAASGIQTSDGYRLDPRCLDFRRYAANPVVLFDHDWDRLPVGRGQVALNENAELAIDITFDRRDFLARKIDRKYRSGFLHGVSVGVRVLDLSADRHGLVIVGSELLEVSSVTIPMDVGAVGVGTGIRVPLPEQRMS